MLIQPLSYNSQKLKVVISYQGGIIVYVNSVLKQGLIVSNEDVSVGYVAWEQQPYTTITTSNTYGQGLQNTINIDASTSTTTAATACLNYTGGGYDDWFLPNATELQYVRTNRIYVSGLSNALYWTSFSSQFNTALCVDFNPSSPYVGAETNAARDGSGSPQGGYVRACRYITFTQ
jgi:hypothetical protein